MAYGFNDDKSKTQVLPFADGSVDVDGTPAYLTFITDDIATFSPPIDIESCLVLDTTDNGLYHFTV